MSAVNVLTLPVLPLPSGVVFPGMVVTVGLESDESAAAADSALRHGGTLLLVPFVNQSFADVGVIATIETQGDLPNGRRALVLRATERAVVGRGSPDPDGATTLWVDATPASQDVDSTDSVMELTVVELKRHYRAAVGVLLEQQGIGRLASALRDITHPGQLADTIHEWPELSLGRRVELLEEIDPTQRLRLALSWVEEAIAEADVKDKIRDGVSKGIEQQQKEFLLRQQLNAIRKELGDTADGSTAAEDYRTRIAAMSLPEHVRTAAVKEVDRLERVGDQGAEQGWIRTWLDIVLGLPWGTMSDDRLDLDTAQTVLDEDTTGLAEAKDRIIEWLAVKALRNQTNMPEVRGRGQGTIILLVGPPGVGKTSLGESVARALGRSFSRIALGGVRDEAEIRGHRRTYVGAQPGRIVRALSESKTMNPVILLDEIDKLTQGWSGDPAAALLEVLDPAQNHTFRDHYLEVDLDLSDVVFIATANSLDTISAPLLDRMEIVHVDGYTDEEKLAIAQNHLFRRQLNQAGLTEDQVEVTPEALRAIIEGYTREPGVRGLERELRKLLRKVAVEGVRQGVQQGVRVDAEHLPSYLGRQRRHVEEVAERVATPGVATGLAVTGAGGDVLFVEALSTPSSDRGTSLQITGQLGDVMKESAALALAVVKANASAFGINLSELDGKQLHIHFPAGAIPKDGPSAGITITTALVSLLTGRPVSRDVAMTGEITLHGKVLPIGGVKQKVLAAHRAGLRTVVLPKRNEPDIEDVPAQIKDEIQFVFADHVQEVITIALLPIRQV
jgi:ATP-dependent Lon protease